MESKRVVHVIDDEETIRKAVGFTLRTAGFAVETYGSGVDFLKIADEAERGSIVLDMHMPDMNGLQVEAALTQMDISMPVVMLTGNGDIALAVQAKFFHSINSLHYWRTLFDFGRSRIFQP